MKFKLLTYLRNLIKKQPILAAVAKPEFIKAQLPKSTFTKKGPGVRARLRERIMKLEPEQREICFAKGWDKGSLHDGDYQLHRKQLAGVRKKKKKK